MKSIQTMGLAACAVLLTACGGAPSEGEMRAAFENQIQQSNDNVKKMAGNNSMTKSMESKLHSFKKVGCKEDGENAYRCDVEMEIEAPFVGRRSVNAPVRFVKASDGWKVSQ